MTKRVLAGVAGFLGVCLSLFAEYTDRSDVFSELNNSSALRFPSLTLSDETSFSFSSAFTGMETTSPEFLPALSMANVTARPQRTDSVALGKDSSKEVVDVRPKLFDYAGGEVGFFYGKSSGKYGREVKGGYIRGEAGDDKFRISAGAAYEESNGRVPRFRGW